MGWLGSGGWGSSRTWVSFRKEEDRYFTSSLPFYLSHSKIQSSMLTERYADPPRRSLRHKWPADGRIRR